MSLRPTFGARYALDRDDGEAGPGVVYRGQVHLPDGALPLVVRVGDAGASATIDGEVPAPSVRAELERVAAALVRAAVRAPRAEGRPSPRRIVRWR